MATEGVALDFPIYVGGTLKGSVKLTPQTGIVRKQELQLGDLSTDAAARFHKYAMLLSLANPTDDFQNLALPSVSTIGDALQQSLDSLITGKHNAALKLLESADPDRQWSIQAPVQKSGKCSSPVNCFQPH